MADKKKKDNKKDIKKKNSNVINSLQQLFKIGIKPNAKNKEDMVFAVKPKIDTSQKKRSLDGPIDFEREKFPAPVKEFLKVWLDTNYLINEEVENRMCLYQDMDLLYYNSPIHSKAVNMIADEVVQADNNMQCIGVEGKKKQKDFILDFYDAISLYSKIRTIAFNIILYGNLGMILDLTSKGIESIILTDIYDFKDRLEFTPYEVKKKIEKNDKFLCSYRQKVDRVDMLIKSIENKENYSSMFKEYLFGFQISDQVLPPWRCLHFRNITNKSAFHPFGTPLYIHAISSFKQFEAAMTLQAAKRAAQVPIDVYKINASNKVSPTEKLMFVTEFFRELFNSGLNRTKKEGVGVGEVMVTINELFEYDQIAPNIDLGNIDDIELLREALIDSSWLPRYMIDPRDGGFGESGIALAQKWKPFARLIFHIQNIILEQLTLMTKIHMIASNQFTPDEIDFVLTMPFPESQVDSDIISSQSDLLTLANDIIDALSDKLLGGDQVPDDVVRDVYQKILPYDDKTIDELIDATLKGALEPKDEEPEDDEPEDSEEPKDEEEAKESKKLNG